jgi:hypothetical protein
MTLSATVLFDRPQCSLAGTLRSILAQSIKTQVMAGFLTVEGIELLLPILRRRRATLDTLVVGTGTYRAFDGLDKLLGAGVSPNALFVHLGHSRKTGTKAIHWFYRYHPMLTARSTTVSLRPNGTTDWRLKRYQLIPHPRFSSDGRLSIPKSVLREPEFWCHPYFTQKIWW